MVAMELLYCLSSHGDRKTKPRWLLRNQVNAPIVLLSSSMAEVIINPAARIVHQRGRGETTVGAKNPAGGETPLG